MSAIFRYDSAIVARFPAVVGGAIVADVRNGPTPPALVADLAAEVERARDRIGATPLSEVPSLAAWRRVFRGFGVDPTQYRSAAEALLRRITKGDALPTINAVVDLANLVSVRYALPVAAFDLGEVGATLVRFATGDEAWADLGGSLTEHPEPGEVIFVDDAGRVSARRWCWRQSRGSAVSVPTRRVLMTVEGHHEDARSDVQAALADVQQLLVAHAGAAIHATALLDATHPELAIAG
jgi:DNA/RNA-binding domain of Phe-tRNA-synthetase-like protein